MLAAFGNKIKDLRRSLGLSQDQLARRLQVTKKTVAEWEQGRQPPSPERALQLARLAAPGRLRRSFTRYALERIGAEPPLVLDALLPQPVARLQPRSSRSQRALPAAELRIITPAGWADRFRALEGLDHYVPIPLLKDAAAAGSP
ncbi:MAG: helix-turn-helix transcriptional regulator, partial [Terriglobia bacterium]